ncbi:MAG: hypothetical protein ACPGUV_14715, partial [Polyangiales bacterium]
RSSQAFLGVLLKHLRLFSAVSEAPAHWPHALDALTHVAQGLRGRMLRLERIDGAPAKQHPELARLLEAGFVLGHRGLEWTSR